MRKKNQTVLKKKFKKEEERTNPLYKSRSVNRPAVIECIENESVWIFKKINFCTTLAQSLSQ